jgi:uncharacterized Zn finger protein
MEHNTFLEITRQNTRKAIERARRIRPRVSIISVSERRYLVSGSKGDAYSVQLAAGNGRLLGACDCRAGLEGQICYHVAAVCGVASGIRQARRLAEERAAGVRREGKRVFIGAIEI